MRALVTGGAGFVGSHTVDALLDRGYEVRVFDNLDPQVHGSERRVPGYLNAGAEFVFGDVRDPEALRVALQDIDVILHLAAAVGVGQSMYEVTKYVDVNTRGTAVLLDLLIHAKHKVRKLVVASSMSIYGEGRYQCSQCGIVYPKLRGEKQLEIRDWEMKCPNCFATVEPNATHEEKLIYPTSIYAISKRDQEEMSLTIGRAYKIPTVALRYFNIYGSRQALSNPYTGVAAIFSSRLLNGNSPIVFEDGQQSRDFIHVSDIVQANLLALESQDADGEVFNVGTGRRMSILELANILRQHLEPERTPRILGQYRKGDIRHCYADIRKISEKLGFKPKITLEDGAEELVNWVRTSQAIDFVDQAKEELVGFKLVS
jgi:dTDP-L-rhamnose 4-epimerase